MYGSSQLWPKGALSANQAFLNHAGDKDLKNLIEDLIKQERTVIKECDALLKDNGIIPSPTMPERPVVRLRIFQQEPDFLIWKFQLQLLHKFPLG